MEVEKNINSTTKTFIAILSLGLVGLLFLIIFGNLSGNLGFQPEGVAITNESGAYINGTGYTLAGTSDQGAAGYVITGIQNATNAVTILSGNYTVSAAGVVTNATATNWVDVEINYTYSRDSTGIKDTNQVINNLTGGAVSFFAFSNVWFVLLAITLLIIIVIAVIAVVSKGGKSNFTS